MASAKEHLTVVSGAPAADVWCPELPWGPVDFGRSEIQPRIIVEVSAHTVETLLLAVSILLLAAFVAGYLPARHSRALQLRPAERNLLSISVRIRTLVGGIGARGTTFWGQKANEQAVSETAREMQNRLDLVACPF